MKTQTLLIFIAVFSISLVVHADENAPPCPQELPEAFSKELKKSRGHEFALGGHRFKLVAPSSWKGLERDYFHHSDEFKKEIEFKDSREGKCYYELNPRGTSHRKTIGIWLEVN